MRTRFIFFFFGVWAYFFPVLLAAQSFTLQELIQKALQHNADILVQDHEKEITRYQWRNALSRVLPCADLEAAYVKSSQKAGSPHFVAANGVTERIAWLSVQQSLWDARRFLELSDTRFRKQQQNVRFRQTRQAVLFQVIQAYFDALKAKGEVRIFKQNLNAFKLLVEQSRSLFENGVVAELDVRKSRVEYLLQKNAFARARKNVIVALNRIKELTGIPIRDTLMVADFPIRKIKLDSLARYLNMAVRFRPEIQYLELSQQQLNAARKLISLERLPSINAGLYYGWDTNGPFPKQDLGWQLYVTLSVPLFHWGALHNNRQIARLRYEQSEVAVDRIRRQIQQEVIDAYEECKIQLQQIHAMQESIQEAEIALRMARLGYREGTVTNLDVINSQKLYTESKVNYLKAVYNFYTAKAMLYWRAGRLREDISWTD